MRKDYNDVRKKYPSGHFWEQYRKPFRMALKETKPAMVMTAFNAIDRKPISGNKNLLKGFCRIRKVGNYISDWGSP